MSIDEDVIAAYQASQGEVWLAPGLLQLCETAEQRRQRERELEALRNLRLCAELLRTRGRSWQLDQLLGDLAVLIEERER